MQLGDIVMIKGHGKATVVHISDDGAVVKLRTEKGVILEVELHVNALINKNESDLN